MVAFLVEAVVFVLLTNSPPREREEGQFTRDTPPQPQGQNDLEDPAGGKRGSRREVLCLFTSESSDRRNFFPNNIKNLE
jgi:hypothetical protein